MILQPRLQVPVADHGFGVPGRDHARCNLEVVKTHPSAADQA
jgi:hypothetical protein